MKTSGQRDTRTPTTGKQIRKHLSAIQEKKVLNVAIPSCSLDVASRSNETLGEEEDGTVVSEIDQTLQSDLDYPSIKSFTHGNKSARQTLSGNYSTKKKKPVKLPDYEPSRKDKLRVLDSLLLLTAQCIDSKRADLYTIFPCLLNQLVDLCDTSVTWKWGEIYFYSIIRLVDTYGMSTTRRKKRGPFSSGRSSFLISLACYLATQMCQFDPDNEPQLAHTFVRSVIPTLVELTHQQRDVCDTPGLTLMYIFLRINVPLNRLVYQSEFSFSSKTIDTMDSSNNASMLEIPHRTLSIYHPATLIRRVPSPISNDTLSDDEDRHHTHICVKEKLNEESYLLKFLKIFWIKCAALGYQRRNRPPEEIALLNPEESITRELDGDKDFWRIYRNLLRDTYNEEDNEAIRSLYIDTFKISQP